MIRTYLLFAICLLALICKLPAQENDSISLSQLLSELDSIREKGKIPGLLLSITTKDSVLYDGGLGMANLSEERPTDRHQLFRMGSISKTFTSLCILKLAEEGNFSLEDRLRDIAPEVPIDNQWAETNPVRIVHLFEHSAGFDDMHFAAFLKVDSVEKDLLDMVHSHRNSLACRWRPGSRFSYSNPGYIILGYLIEKFSGMSYQAYIQQNIFAPIGMDMSNFHHKPSDFSSMAKGYRWRGGEHLPLSFQPINGGPAGALNSNGADMARFIQMFLNNGMVDGRQVFSKNILQQIKQPRSTLAAKTGLTHLYAKAIYPSGRGIKAPFYGHNGGIPGFSSSFAFNEELGVGYALSRNMNGDNRKMIERIFEFFRQRHPKPDPKGPADVAERIKPWMGTYAFASPRNQILGFTETVFTLVKLRYENDTLYRQEMWSEPDKYIVNQDLQLRSATGTFFTQVLTEDADGRKVLTGGQHFVKGNHIWLNAKRIWLALSGILSFLFGLMGGLWMLISWLGKVSLQARPVLTPLALGAIGLVVATIAFLISSVELDHLADIHAGTISVFIGSLVFPIGAFGGLVQSIRHYGRIDSGFQRNFLVVMAMLMCSLASFLFFNQWIGMRLWAY
ncbi:MAG: serine hydrolase [Bacteroidota bacterium]